MVTACMAAVDRVVSPRVGMARKAGSMSDLRMSDLRMGRVGAAFAVIGTYYEMSDAGV